MTSIKCPICDRILEPGSTDLHHFVPRQYGGAKIPPIEIHKFCHSKIHSVFTNRELAKTYNTPTAIRAHPEFEKFIAWVAKKEPSYYDKNTQTVKRKTRR